ncbi:MAG: hypothetical protein D6785_06995 [Planctomycetota bacterium]|nr:MAG: hypothetical protein D6785_06995 [Planctomycetota bacterium]
MKKRFLTFLALCFLAISCSQPPAPRKTEPKEDPNLSEKTLNATQNMKDLQKEKVEEETEKEKK